MPGYILHLVSVHMLLERLPVESPYRTRTLRCAMSFMWGVFCLTRRFRKQFLTFMIRRFVTG